MKHKIFKLLIWFFFFLGKTLKKKHLPKIANIIGNIWYFLPISRNKIALSSIKIAFDKELEECEVLLKKFFKELALIILEIAYIVQHKESLKLWAEASGLENLNNALRKGNGVIALSGHIGNIPIMLAWLAENNYPVAVLYKEGKYLPKGFLYNLIKSYNIHPIPFISDKDVPKEVIRALNKNMIVFMLADQARPGVYAKFFGKYVQCQRGPFVIAQRKEAPIIPVFITRENRRHRIVIYPELTIQSDKEGKVFSDEDIIAFSEKYNDILEKLIRQHPEQYYWFHRRFKKMKKTVITIVKSHFITKLKCHILF